MKHQWLEAIQYYYPECKTSKTFLQPTDITVTTYQDLYSKRERLRDYFEQQEI
ncbi:hypothetical protein [Enterococcus sp. DIV2371]|uniref:hypothetical protein n=1 Tax=unclassified Enterococcus TaxID=2608891 RepID=UPI001AC1AF35|nr:hypothetical protein [Enterococcus sp. DIV1271a]